MTLDQLLPQFLALAGVASIIAAIVNSLKQLGFVKDGDAPTASLLLNLAGFILLVAFSVFKPDLDIAGLDAAAATIAQVLTLIVGFVVEFGLTKGAHQLLKGAPVIGKSYSQT